jgi:hypothetical protein
VTTIFPTYGIEMRRIKMWDDDAVDLVLVLSPEHS